MGVKEPAAHKARRKMVQNLEKEVLRLESRSFRPEILEEINIRILPMPLEDDGLPAFKPCFFSPHGNDLMEPDDKLIERKYPLYGDSVWDIEWPPMYWARGLREYFNYYTKACSIYQPRLPPAGVQKDIAKYRFKQLYECKSYRNAILYDWDVLDAIYMLGQSHFKAAMISNLNGDDRITRGELLSLLRIMEGQSKRPVLVDHMIVPVLLFSFVGLQHGRIIHAHFDGANLIIRKSELYDFRTKNADALKLFARWFYSSATGDTTRG